jgi:uncharacterized OsmC-like protein
MVDVRIKARPIGAVAELQRYGHPMVTSRTGGEIGLVTGASEPGFNPLDLMFASLSACLVLSARIAASRLGVLDRFESASADVTGEKAPDEPSRLARFDAHIRISGELTAAEREQIVAMAEEICTVSNTLRTPAIISVSGD